MNRYRLPRVGWRISLPSNPDSASHDCTGWRHRLLSTRGQQIHTMSVERHDRCAIAILDAKGIVIAWHDHLPYARSCDPEVLSRHMSQFYLPTDIAIHVPTRHLWIAAEYGMDTQRGWRRRPSGEIFWGVTVMQSILLGDGELLGYSHVTRSIRGSALQCPMPLRAGFPGMESLALTA